MDSCDEQNSQYFKHLSELQTAFGEAYKEFLAADAHKDVLLGRLKTAESGIALYQTYGRPFNNMNITSATIDISLYENLVTE